MTVKMSCACWNESISEPICFKRNSKMVCVVVSSQVDLGYQSAVSGINSLRD